MSISADSDVNYVLERLQEWGKDGQASFDKDQWHGFLGTLSSQSLTEAHAKGLVENLAAIGRISSNQYFVFQAIYQILLQISEVRKLAETWALPSHPMVKTLNESLEFGAYLASEELALEVKEIMEMTESHAGSDLLPPRLLALYQLQISSPAYSIIDNLVGMGLAAENKDPLTLFFNRRRKVLAGINETDIITDTLSIMEKNAVIHLRYTAVFEAVKRKDFEGFIQAINTLEQDQKVVFDSQYNELQQRAASSPETQTQFEHQKKTLALLVSLKETIFQCFRYFAEKNLNEGIKLIDKIKPIHHQMIQVCDNSVALIFIGLIKTGKSTIVDTIIGESVSPSRTEPMTAIPVRYIHDPNATEPVMLVPFALQLNKVIRSIKMIVEHEGKEEVSRQLRFTHLRSLLEKIDKGLIIRDTYKGSKDVLEASIDIHDLYRLAVQEHFPASLNLELPLDWSQGLDSFLTVSAKFPYAFGITSAVKLSVIDTPGVNEAGVEKLNLNHIINEAVDVSHYVAFTVLPRNNEAKDNSKLKRLLTRIANSTKTPTLVLATNRDSLKESEEELQNNRLHIANALRDGPIDYPVDQVYVVSGKRKLLGDKMLEYIAKHNRKPELDDQDPTARQLADEWALFAGNGYSEEEKKEDYADMSLSALKKRSEKLLAASHMKPPMDRMVNTAARNASILSCNKAIEKTLEASQQVTEYLRRIQHATEADANRVEMLTATCEEVYQSITAGVHEIRGFLAKKVSEFRRNLQQDCEKALYDFRETIPNVIEGDEQWEFKSKQDAEVKVQESIRTALQTFNEVLDKIFDQKKIELGKLAEEVQKATDEKIFQPLARIFAEMREQTEDFNPKISNADFQLDTTSLGYADNVISSHEKQTSMKNKLSSLLHGHLPDSKKDVFLAKVQEVREIAMEKLEENNKTLVSSASKRVEKHMGKILDDLFMQALRRVLQTKEALSERERLQGDAERVTHLYSRVQETIIPLKGLLVTVAAE